MRSGSGCFILIADICRDTTIYEEQWNLAERNRSIGAARGSGSIGMIDFFHFLNADACPGTAWNFVISSSVFVNVTLAIMFVRAYHYCLIVADLEAPPLAPGLDLLCCGRSSGVHTFVSAGYSSIARRRAFATGNEETSRSSFSSDAFRLSG